VTLRGRFLLLFALLAVVPLVALAIFDYYRSDVAIRGLVAAQTGDIASRTADALRMRLDVVGADLALLANNDETRHLYDAWRGHDPAAIARARSTAHPYLENAWRVIGRPLAWVEWRDTANVVIERFDHGVAPDVAMPQHQQLTTRRVTGGDARGIGHIVVAIDLDSLGARELLDAHVGRTGYTVLFDTADSRVVLDPARRRSERGGAAVESFRSTAPGGSPRASRSIKYVERDSARIASVAIVPGQSLAVLSAATVSEFAAPLTTVRATNLVLSLAITGVLSVAFILLGGRLTHPLEMLTGAADEIGRGNFEPDLPPGGNDEVGRLTGAVHTMAAKVGDMVRQLEASRQMAAVGEFAGQIAHEIRNPLTSIKLNLQSLERDARDGLVAESSRRSVEICLDEIRRLDRIVRGVLRLGMASRAELRPVSARAVVQRAMVVAEPELRERGVRLESEYGVGDDTVRADPERLTGALLNLLLNAAEAAPGGSSVAVTTSVVGNGPLSTKVVRICISDTGSGIPSELRDRIFDPFFSTKKDGTGLGLALALRDVDDHHGRLYLDARPAASGATFVIELPLLTGDAA
jgi:signal transduction histidine kinase